MSKVLLKFFYIFLIVNISEARYNFVPKFYGQDSAIIVDADKAVPPTNNLPVQYPTKVRLPPPFPLWRHFPRYHIIPPPPPGQILSINTWPKRGSIKPAVAQTTEGKTRISSPITSSSTSTTTTSTTTEPPTTSTTTTTTTSVPITTTVPDTATYTPKPVNVNSKFRIDTVPFVTDDEFPKELLDLAQNKLGLKSLDEIPSISELGQLLGTNSPHETLKYIKQLTSNEQGVALLKAYIESTDYTDNAGDLDNYNSGKNSGNDDDADEEDDDDEEIEQDLGDIEEPLKVNDEGLVVINDPDINDDYELDNIKEQDTLELTTPKTLTKPRKTPQIITKLNSVKADKTGFFERIANYMHLNNLWHKDVKNQKSQDIVEQIGDNKNSPSNDINRITLQGAKVENEQDSAEVEEQPEDQPILVREPIPYNYPVPLRPQTSTTTTSTTTTTIKPSTAPSTSFSSSNPAPNNSVVHLNTPRVLIPHVQHLARVTKISPEKIEDFLASKPKLLQLANKVSRFPIGYDRNSAIEAQVMAAVQRALEQDEDLKKLLDSAATLK